MIYLGNVWVIPFTFVIAVCLSILPLPAWFDFFRPEWVSIVAVYWCIAVPRVFGVGSAWCVGLILDVATGTLLGQNALGLCMVAFIACRLYQQIRTSPLSQQAVVVMLLIGIKQTIVLWVYGAIGRLPSDLLFYFTPTLLSLIIWPWAFIMLRNIRRHYRIS